MTKKKLLRALGSALAGSFVAVCAAQDDVVNVYNWSDYIAKDTIANFEQRTGMKVNYDVFDSNEVLEGKMLAGNTGYDVVVPSLTFLSRQIEAGAYAELDKSLLPNLTEMDSLLMGLVEPLDKGNALSVIYLWGTTGIGFNIGKVAERLGPDAPTDSWSLLFDPANAAKLADCGISVLDAPTEVIPAAMNYLGIDPASVKKSDFEKGVALLQKLRPHVTKFHSSQYISDLANGDICVALGWSGDILQARDRAEEAGAGVGIAYVIPKEGALQWYDMLAIPIDAPNPKGAHAFINFLMEPEVMTEIVNYVNFASGNKTANDAVEPEIRADKSIFPDEKTKAKLWVPPVYGTRTDRTVTRLWTKLKTGK